MKIASIQHISMDTILTAINSTALTMNTFSPKMKFTALSYA